MKSVTDDASWSAGQGPNRPRVLALQVRVALPVGILASGLALFVILSREPDQATLPSTAPQAIRTRVTDLRVRDYPVVITTHGVVQPHNAVTLSAQVSGQIAHLSPSLDTGAFFSEGEVLAELDARDYQIALAMAEARQLGARSALRLATLNHDLPEQTHEPSLAVELRAAVSNAAEPVWKAKIIRTEGAVDENSLDLFAIARVEDPFGLKSGQPPLRIGQPVTASIAGKTLTNVVALPRGAVRQLDQVLLVQRTNETNLTLMPRTIVPVWSDAEHIVVRDSSIADGTLLATTHLVYAPSGARAEIIPDIPADLVGRDTNAPAVIATGVTNARPAATVSGRNATANWHGSSPAMNEHSSYLR